MHIQLPQNRFPNCTPSSITIDVGGQSVRSESDCVAISRVDESGYLSLGTPVHFEYRGNSFNGTVTGYQFTWHADNTIEVEYMVTDGFMGVAFLMNEVAVPLDKVHQ